MKLFFKEGFVTPLPVFIIGTYNSEGKPNAMNAAWAGQVGKKYISISLGSHTTTENIKEQKEFTVSFATKAQVIPADFVGIAAQKKVPDKLDRTGWHAVKAEHVNAPIFEELPVALECKVLEIKEEYNEIRIVGEIVGMYADESVLTDGKVDLEKLHPIMFDSIGVSYRTIGEEIGGAWDVGKKLM